MITLLALLLALWAAYRYDRAAYSIKNLKD